MHPEPSALGAPAVFAWAILAAMEEREAAIVECEGEGTAPGVGPGCRVDQAGLAGARRLCIEEHRPNVELELIPFDPCYAEPSAVGEGDDFVGLGREIACDASFPQQDSLGPEGFTHGAEA